MANDPPVYILIRRTIDWHDESAVNNNVAPDFRPKMETWNSTFNMPYHRFRARLKEITQLNLSRVAGAVIAPLDQTPPGAIIAPIDDDDWFSPDLAANLLKSYDPAIRGYSWTRYLLEAPPTPVALRRLFSRLRRSKNTAGNDKFTCFSNNYAVTNAVGAGALAMSHTGASRYYDEHPADVNRLPSVLSIQNKNLSSQTVLNWRRPSISPTMLRRRYRRYRALYGRMTLPLALNWAKPYVELMAELMDDLRLV